MKKLLFILSFCLPFTLMAQNIEKPVKLGCYPPNGTNRILNKNPNAKKYFENYFLQNIDNADIHFKKFWQVTKDLDSFRNQSFEKLFPDYYQLLAPHL